MRQQLLLTVLAFVLGLSVGGLVFGQKDGRDEAARIEALSDRPAATPPAMPAASDPVREDAIVTLPATTLELSSDPESVQSVDIGPMSLEQQMQVMLARWASLERRFNELGQRVGSLERFDRTASDSATDEAAGGKERPVMPTDTPQNRRAALVASGVPEPDADDIVWRQSEQAMARLELQDRAIREGWFRTDRYFTELRGLNGDRVDLRSEVGAESYDRYLYQTGESNRVQIGSVIQGSPAERSGLASGDIIESYGGEPIFDFTDLREATTAGARDELVPLRVRRGDAVFETWIERGPVGVQLESASLAPDA